MKKVAIIGAGISGLSSANLLKKEFEVKVFEKNDKSGGLIRCENVDGNLYHRVGGHVFNSKNTKVLDWFWSFFNKEEEFLKADRKAAILLNNKLVNYPIENHLYMLEQDIVEDIVSDLIRSAANAPAFADFQDMVNFYGNFETFLKMNFGEVLYNLYFKPYNSKLWKNINLSDMPLDWLEGKLPMPDYKEIIFRNIMRKPETEMVHSSFFYPKNNGSQFIIDRLSQNIEIQHNKNIASIGKFNNKLIINAEEEFDYIIYTGDVRQLPEILAFNIMSYKSTFYKKEKPIEILSGINRNFRSNGTTSVLCLTDDTDLSWLYLPEPSVKPHRIIYTGNFSKNNNSKKLTCVVEFMGKIDYHDIKEELKQLPGQLVPLSYHYQQNSYIIQSFETRKIIKSLKEYLAQHNIFLVGRFAEWEYYNMDKCIESAMQTTALMLDKELVK